MAKFAICRRCHAPIISVDNRCGMCGSPVYATYRKHRGIPLRIRRRAQHWAAQRDLLARTGMDADTVTRKAYALHEELMQRFPWDVIVTNGLDNPFMAGSARRVLINQVVRYCRKIESTSVKHSAQFAKLRRMKKPAQSVRATPARRRAA